MKKWTGLLAIALLIFSQGCLKKGISFDFGHTTSFTIPSQLGISLPVSLPTGDVATNSEQEFENNDTKAKWVQSIVLKSLILTITNPVNEDFSMLKSIHIFMNADGLDEVEIAHLDPIVNDQVKTLEMVSTNVELAEYIKQPKYSLRVEVVTDEAPLFDTTVETALAFDVTANAPAFQ